MSQYTSYYLYQKYEQRDGQAPIPVYPNVFSVDGDGTLPRIIKQNNDPNCGYVSFNGKFKATYSGGQTYSAECDSNTELTTATTRPSGYERSAMTTAEIGNCVTSIDISAFYGCSSLTSINIPSGITSIGNNAFQYCTGLTNITCLATTPPTLGSNVFNNTNNCPIYVHCESVSAYKAANGWSAYESRIRGIPPCYEPSSNKLEITIDSGSTYSLSCDTTSSITETEVYDLISGHLPSGSYYDLDIQINGCVTSIDKNAFGSYAITKAERMNISIPNSVTSIGNFAFYCGNKSADSAYMNVTIGSGITSIGNYAFKAEATDDENMKGCTLIVTIYAETPPTIGTNPFNAIGTYTDLRIYVPSTAVNTYKAASGWSTYASQIRAIS